MLRGIYSAASAMSLSTQKMNLFAQNLSNSQTTGYKKKVYSVHSFQDMLVNIPNIEGKEGEKIKVATGSYIDNAGVRQRQGRLKATGNALDMAVMGEGVYFQLEVNDPQNTDPANKRYTITRNGNFKINQQNYLVNQNGDYVLDTNNQRIRLLANNNRSDQPFVPGQEQTSRAGNQINIDSFGRIQNTVNNTGNPTQIKLVNYVDDPAAQQDDRVQMQQILKKYGLNMPLDSELLQSMDPMAPVAPDGDKISLHQGYLEASNVDITSEMIMLMMTSKDYDMSQKIISTEDKVLDKTINEMGRLQ